MSFNIKRQPFIRFSKNVRMLLILNSQRSRPETNRLILLIITIAINITNVGVDGG